MICDQLIAAYLGGLKERFSCSVQPNGRLCVVTPYLYPDHDNVEVFVRQRGDVVVVSDLGETLRRLDTVGMDVLDMPNLAYTARRIADGFNVRIIDGVIFKEGRVEQAGRLVFEVMSVCKDVGSLVYGGKAYKPIRFQEEVGTFLTNNQFQFDRNVPKQGLSGTTYTISFRVWVGGARGMLIESLSPSKTSGVRRKVNATFRMWTDIQDRSQEVRVSLLNDELIPFKLEDIRLLERVSLVRRWTHSDELLSTLQTPA